MGIPDYQSLMLPLLTAFGDGREHRFAEVVEALCDEFGLSQAEREQLLPSGQDRVVRNRVGWARTYLGKAGLLRTARRGFMQITDRGCDVLASNPVRVDVKFLERFPEFVEFREVRHERAEGRTEKRAPAIPESSADATPEEALDASHERLRVELESDNLERVKSCSPSFFERMVVELLVKMGYGGSLFDAGQAIGRSGDGGIDGNIKEDRLGLDQIYLQAKRWDSTVGRPEIQKFAGALQGHRARKGVFITTSSYSREALVPFQRGGGRGLRSNWVSASRAAPLGIGIRRSSAGRLRDRGAR